MSYCNKANNKKFLNEMLGKYGDKIKEKKKSE